MDREYVHAMRLTGDASVPVDRTLPAETAVAIEYNGIGYAVMMATPTALEDFAVGFSLAEQVIADTSEVEGVEARQIDNGWLLKIALPAARQDAIIARARTRVSESSCGLCGIENLEQALRPLPPVTARDKVENRAIFAALDELRVHQPLGRATGGTHVAAFCAPDGMILTAREDVGRHTALDKLIGARALHGEGVAGGFIMLSSRCSYELVEKAVIANCPLLVTISTATTLAVSRARDAGLRLVALARPDAMLELTAPFPPD